jgi:flagellar basal-body rod protein FlgG
VQIPNQARDVTINANGEVLVKLDGQAALQNVGQIQTAIFANEAGLEAIGDNLFLETPASGQVQAGVPGAPGFGNIMQGFVETSNVNVVSEITSLITAQRAYEMNSKVITASDEMLSTLARLR